MPTILLALHNDEMCSVDAETMSFVSSSTTHLSSLRPCEIVSDCDNEEVGRWARENDVPFLVRKDFVCHTADDVAKQYITRCLGLQLNSTPSDLCSCFPKGKSRMV